MERRETIFVEDGVLRCALNGQSLWQFKANEIICLAEYTNDHGPYGEDWFLVFLTKDDDDNLYEVPVSADIDKVFIYLSEFWGTKISLGLAASTTWQSRIIYPLHLAGKEFYHFEEVRETTFSKRIRALLVPTCKISLCSTVITLMRGYE